MSRTGPRMEPIQRVCCANVHPQLRAYVDETGDRGHSGRSSKFFAFSAVLLSEEDEPELRRAMSLLRREMGTPVGKALHWKDHVKNFDRRQRVSTVLGRLSGLQVIYVIVEKAAIPATSHMRTDHTVFYNYAAGLMMERLLLATQGWPGGRHKLVVRFGHVRGFDHTTTIDYFQVKRIMPPELPWSILHGKVHFENQAEWDGLQAADQYAGMLNAAISPDPYGGYEQHHLLAVKHQIRGFQDAQAWGRGFKVLGNPLAFTSLPWWQSLGI